jgi:hypothetical protein
MGGIRASPQLGRRGVRVGDSGGARLWASGSTHGWLTGFVNRDRRSVGRGPLTIWPRGLFAPGQHTTPIGHPFDTQTARKCPTFHLQRGRFDWKTGHLLDETRSSVGTPVKTQQRRLRPRIISTQNCAYIHSWTTYTQLPSARRDRCREAHGAISCYSLRNKWRRAEPRWGRYCRSGAFACALHPSRADRNPSFCGELGQACACSVLLGFRVVAWVACEVRLRQPWLAKDGFHAPLLGAPHRAPRGNLFPRQSVCQPRRQLLNPGHYLPRYLTAVFCVVQDCCLGALCTPVKRIHGPLAWPHWD